MYPPQDIGQLIRLIVSLPRGLAKIDVLSLLLIQCSSIFVNHLLPRKVPDNPLHYPYLHLFDLAYISVMSDLIKIRPQATLTIYNCLKKDRT